MDPIEIAQQIEVSEEPGGRYAIHVPQWFASLGAILVLTAVAGTAVSHAILLYRFTNHEDEPYHEKAVAEIHSLALGVNECSINTLGTAARLDRIERQLDKIQETQKK